jgi:Ca2+-binding EF-hand superfamily protein
MGNQNVKESPTVEQIQSRYRVTREQILALQAAFLSESQRSKKSSAIDCATFCRVVERLRADHPEFVPFDKDLAPVVFALADTDHSNSVDACEVVAALSVFTSQDKAEKAKLVFRVIDRDNSGTLTKQEIKKHAAKVLRLAQQLVTDDLRAKMKDQDMEKLGKLAAWSMSKGMNIFEKKFSDDIVRDIFSHDTDRDGLISEQEWLHVMRFSYYFLCFVVTRNEQGCGIVEHCKVSD